MKSKRGKGSKGEKSRQQKYVEKNREKVNAANNLRNKARLKKRKLLKDAHNLSEKRLPTPEEAQSDDPNSSTFDIELALSLPRSDGPLPPSSPPSIMDESDDGLDEFDALSDRFVMWSNTVDDIMAAFGRYWNARDGWKPKQPFTRTRYESQFYVYSLSGKRILKSARIILSGLTPGEVRWVELLDMIENVSAHVSFMESIRAAWKEITI
ncbi:hypothetical protein BDN70DRAFT_901124 [Pholiota conissans]|uniref:Uncharacterized protein n=1 Tax=Pholiota conissans TaxID=109636 RepID=A0A9P6CS31_9AGAR|nr:hypothetical protein BDN70DRAFT_901124 [Pholiota conissans]